MVHSLGLRNVEGDKGDPEILGHYQAAKSLIDGFLTKV